MEPEPGESHGKLENVFVLDSRELGEVPLMKQSAGGHCTLMMLAKKHNHWVSFGFSGEKEAFRRALRYPKVSGLRPGPVRAVRVAG